MDEFGFRAEDEDGIILIVCSNAGSDEYKYLDAVKKKNRPRPILVEIQGKLFEKYQFRNFALTIQEAKDLSKELSRMVDYLES